MIVCSSLRHLFITLMLYKVRCFVSLFLNVYSVFFFLQILMHTKDMVQKVRKMLYYT